MHLNLLNISVCDERGSERSKEKNINQKDEEEKYLPHLWIPCSQIAH